MIALGDRRVLVTGAAGSIGYAIAEAVIAAGGQAWLVDLDTPRLAEAAAALGPSAHAVPGDLGAPDGPVTVWERTVAESGRIDVLVNCAGIYEHADLDTTDEAWAAVWKRSLDVNLLAPAALSRNAVRLFSNQPDGGVIINISSAAAFRGGYDGYAHYAAAKSGLIALTRNIARHHGRQGVTAFTIAPGFVDTPMADSLRDENGIQTSIDQTGLGEVAQPSDVANVVLLLATGLARHATGTTIDVNSASYLH